LDNTKYSISQIKDKIRNLYKSIEGIQDICLHENTIIKHSDERRSVMKICRDCDKIIGYPSNDELKQNGYI